MNEEIRKLALKSKENPIKIVLVGGPLDGKIVSFKTYPPAGWIFEAPIINYLTLGKELKWAKYKIAAGNIAEHWPVN